VRAALVIGKYTFVKNCELSQTTATAENSKTGYTIYLHIENNDSVQKQEVKTDLPMETGDGSIN